MSNHNMAQSLKNLSHLQELIHRLNLNEFCPQQLTFADAVDIHWSSLHNKKIKTERDLPSAFLYKLLTMDYRVRYLSASDKTQSVNNENEEMYEDFNDFLTDENIISAGNSEEENIHLMDVQMVLFHFSDSFLRQDMVTKLSSCQYALPLLVPNPHSAETEFPLWTFRQIKKSWKSADGSSRTLPVWQIKTPMVCFYRLGSVSTSKSQLLNSLINPKHDTFFHRDCSGSSRTRFLMEGLVEIAWYCPAGNNDDIFNECIAFCNLHGDITEHRATAHFLNEAATVNVVLMQDMQQQQDNELLKTPLICLVSDLEKGNCGRMEAESKMNIGLKGRNLAEMNKVLITTIGNMLKKCNSGRTFCLEEMSELAKLHGIRVDEDNQECKKGKIRALEVMKTLEGEELSQIKGKFLPCQGKLWHEWSKKNKQLYRLNGNIEQMKSKIEQEMKLIRNQQRTFIDSALRKSVCENLKKTQSAENKYFVTWLGIHIDDLFKKQLSEFKQHCDKHWSEVQKFKHNSEITAAFKKKEEELEMLTERVQSVTVGLEHIVREMGQIYEAWASMPDQMAAEVSSLPALAAELLISGHPLELMDGDAAHVPLIWIQSVLDSVIDRLGDQRVYVLSVLGLQSSGKSTMLNAMFGLQFAVSAGRCTRGAFMQLIKVKEEFREELKFDFLLVVDTEGMRSLELPDKSTLIHDNELATFVTGVANMTLINISGENSAEMQDIIQIVVQAFLRMRKVNLTPSCMFVHQNVTDISATEKNMEGRRRLQEKLDKITHIAATQEVCNAECFADVIKFDIEKDVHYFAQLWEGNPPMAPPNPRYSENIEKLKEAILISAKHQKSLTLSEFKDRIKDLWSAVLNEDFVFSFKNTQEIAAYRKLEVMYWNWTWALRQEMLSIENKLHKRIENGMLQSVTKGMVNEEISKKFDDVMREIEIFFTDDRNADILMHWKARTETKINDIKNILSDETERNVTELIKLKAARKMLDMKKTQYENELFKLSKELASRLKDKVTGGQELKNEFDSMWVKWLSEVKTEMPPVRDVSIQQEVLKMLTSTFETRSVHSSRQSGLYRQICHKGEYSDYVTVKRNINTLGILHYRLETKDHDKVRELAQQTVREAEKSIVKAPVAKMGYNNTYIQEIVNNVKKKVSEFKSNTFMLRNEFTVDLSLFVCDIAVQKFTQLHKVYREANDPLIYLGNKKQEFFIIFKKQCEGATSTTVFAELVCSKLKPSILQAVYDKALTDATNEMKSNNPAFNGNRSNLEKHILQDLAQAEDFQQFITYILNPKKHFVHFIEKTFKENMVKGEQPRILQVLQNALKKTHISVTAAIQKATEYVKQKRGAVEKWLEKFSLELQDKMKFSVNDLMAAQYQEVTDTEFLGEAVNNALQSVTIDLAANLGLISSVSMEMFRVRPEDILIEQLCGCWVQCPFCKAICTNTIEGHDGDHSVPFHRPEGINGWIWDKTENLVLDFCTSLVASDCSIVLSDEKRVPYKKYREAGPDYACWSITPDTSEQSYWKWFVCRFQEDLEKHYNKTFQGKGEIPADWRSITKENALSSLDAAI